MSDCNIITSVDPENRWAKLKRGGKKRFTDEELRQHANESARRWYNENRERINNDPVAVEKRRYRAKTYYERNKELVIERSKARNRALKAQRELERQNKQDPNNVLIMVDNNQNKPKTTEDEFKSSEAIDHNPATQTFQGETIIEISSGPRYDLYKLYVAFYQYNQDGCVHTRIRPVFEIFSSTKFIVSDKPQPEDEYEIYEKPEFFRIRDKYTKIKNIPTEIMIYNDNAIFHVHKSLMLEHEITPIKTPILILQDD